MEKTYAVKGLMEWEINLPTGLKSRPYIRILFEGGQISGYGIAPARFTTADKRIQFLLENSPYYRNGKIFRYENRF